MSGDDRTLNLGRLTDAEAADWILESDPLEPAIHEIASRIVGILSRRGPGAAGLHRRAPYCESGGREFEAFPAHDLCH